MQPTLGEIPPHWVNGKTLIDFTGVRISPSSSVFVYVLTNAMPDWKETGCCPRAASRVPGSLYLLCLCWTGTGAVESSTFAVLSPCLQAARISGKSNRMHLFLFRVCFTDTASQCVTKSNNHKGKDKIRGKYKGTGWLKCIAMTHWLLSLGCWLKPRADK